MAASQDASQDSDVRLAETLETTVRLGLILLLIAWCFLIVSPFLLPIAWAAIIAVAIHPVQQRFAERLGGRPVLAALITTLLLLMLLIGPMVLLGETLVETSVGLAKRLREGSLTLPAPPERVAEWPLIGAPLYEFWSLATNNIGGALSELVPYMKPAAAWLAKVATGAGFALLQTLAAILITGVLLSWADHARIFSAAVVRRIASDRGAELVDLVEKTVRSVATGILGIAIVQSVLAGLGMLAVDLPGAGFWTLVTLLICVVQLGPWLVLVPAVIYVFSVGDAVTATGFMIWSLGVGLFDNITKPFVMGRGVKAPIVVIFVGAIGGLLTMGIVGLFVGAVVLVIGHTLLFEWLGIRTSDAGDANTTAAGG